MAYREYSPEELRQMQLEAAQRVREMQRQARQRLEGSQRAYSSQSASPAPSEPAASQTRNEQPSHQHTSSPMPNDYRQTFPPAIRRRMPSNDLFGLSGLMGIDGDRLTILLLTLLLSSQGQCSPGLMAALFWLLAD